MYLKRYYFNCYENKKKEDVSMKKVKLILKVLLGLLVTGILCVVLIAVLFFSVNGKEQEDKEKVLEANGNGKVLILYQESRMGLTKEAVEEKIKNAELIKGIKVDKANSSISDVVKEIITN